MAISVGDAVLKITGDTSGLDKALEDTKKKVQDTDTALRNVGLGMMAAGTAIAVGLGVAVKSAEEERLTIVKLEQALKNVGVAYSEVSESLEKNMAATMRKTGVSDEQQRDALRKLIIVTGNYKEALDLLPLAIDMAAAMDMDLVGASQLLGRVMEGNVGILTRYGIVLKEGATVAEALAAIQEKVGGTAEAAASPMAILSETMGEMSETIGRALLPALNDLLQNNIIPVVEKITKWIEVNPKVVEGVAMLAGALLAGGGLIFAMSMLSKAIIAVNTALIIMQSLTGVGILKVLAGLAVAGGAIYGMNKLMEGSSSPVVPLQHGGIVTRPTLAMVGESGAEAVMPLDRMGSMGGTTLNIHVGNFMGDELSLRQFTRRISDIIKQEDRRTVNPPTLTKYYSEAKHL